MLEDAEQLRWPIAADRQVKPLEGHIDKHAEAGPEGDSGGVAVALVVTFVEALARRRTFHHLLASSTRGAAQHSGVRSPDF